MRIQAHPGAEAHVGVRERRRRRRHERRHVEVVAEGEVRRAHAAQERAEHRTRVLVCHEAQQRHERVGGRARGKVVRDARRVVQPQQALEAARREELAARHRVAKEPLEEAAHDVERRDRAVVVARRRLRHRMVRLVEAHRGRRQRLRRRHRAAAGAQQVHATRRGRRHVCVRLVEQAVHRCKHVREHRRLQARVVPHELVDRGAERVRIVAVEQDARVRRRVEHAQQALDDRVRTHLRETRLVQAQRADRGRRGAQQVEARLDVRDDRADKCLWQPLLLDGAEQRRLVVHKRRHDGNRKRKHRHAEARAVLHDRAQRCDQRRVDQVAQALARARRRHQVLEELEQLPQHKHLPVRRRLEHAAHKRRDVRHERVDAAHRDKLLERRRVGVHRTVEQADCARARALHKEAVCRRQPRELEQLRNEPRADDHAAARDRRREVRDERHERIDVRVERRHTAAQALRHAVQ